MGTSSAPDVSSPSGGFRRSVGALLIALALLGHLYAAHAIGGSRIAYTHHVLGFALILLVTGGIIAALGYRFWPSRSALTWLAIGAVQALVGLWVALAPVRAAHTP